MFEMKTHGKLLDSLLEGGVVTTYNCPPTIGNIVTLVIHTERRSLDVDIGFEMKGTVDRIEGGVVYLRDEERIK